ncbi:hypothetical protein DID88_007426 [Monilinia fructigena]|uniref:PNPLA domain-containing protein n=1 Tax=Monilinia fructigena TaxID=38457 RepID=A0A395J915_9HELO|nr:hypothetical protein DID88_007426 [Monilinia fructigena]
MADLCHKTDGPSSLSEEGYDESLLPDFHREFISEEHLQAFSNALSAPDPSPTSDDLSTHSQAQSPREPSTPRRSSIDIRRNSKVEGGRGKGEKRKVGKKPRRSKDETREGHLYWILKWPLLLVVFMWIGGLGLTYLITRLYIWTYEHFIAWRGKRNRLREQLHSTTNYGDWVKEAKELDTFLGNDNWKVEDEYAYYDSQTVRRVLEQIRRCRRKIEQERAGNSSNENATTKAKAVEDLIALIEACVKNNFVGVENSRLYSQTYYGTKDLVQEFIDEVEKGVSILVTSNELQGEEKRTLFKRMHTNYGRTALCLSGGASFAYYHFGVVKALLDANLLPEVITGTSGGALVAALVATRTNDELKSLLVPALAALFLKLTLILTSFFFSSRGSVGQPVTHRRGRGWRGGFLGSATEQYLKLDLKKWLKVDASRWTTKCISNIDVYCQSRLNVERKIESGRRITRQGFRRGSIESILSVEDMRSLFVGSTTGSEAEGETATQTDDELTDGVVTSEDESDELRLKMSEKEPLINRNKE